MKVTALIPEDIIADTRKFTGGKNITESLLIALRDFVGRQKIKRLVRKLKTNPLEFEKGFTADGISKLDRQR